MDSTRVTRLLNLVITGNLEEASKLHYEWIKKGVLSLSDSKYFIQEVMKIGNPLP
jgi:polyhydroxyalkanoate synthesis regulator phasin